MDAVTQPGVRPATPADVPAILELIKGLAEFVNNLDKVISTEESMTEALFGEHPAVFAHVAEHDSGNGPEVVGFTLWFLTFSTWLGTHGIWIHDLYVRPEFRGQGHGGALFRELRKICNERGYTRMEWTVYDWNTAAHKFYEDLGAKRETEFSVFRLDGEHLRRS